MLINTDSIIGALSWWNQVGLVALQFVGQNSVVDFCVRVAIRWFDVAWFVVYVTVFAVCEWQRANRGEFTHRLGVMADTLRHVVVGVVLVFVTHIIKSILGSSRPLLDLQGTGILGQGSLDVYASFPSLHAALFMYMGCVAGSLVSHRWFRVLTIITVVWISVSRIIAGYHYPIDVLAGWVLGLIAFLIVHRKQYV